MILPSPFAQWHRIATGNSVCDTGSGEPSMWLWAIYGCACYRSTTSGS